MAYGHNYCCMVHSGMNESLITLSWVWGLDLKCVEQEREGISSDFSHLIRNTDF